MIPGKSVFADGWFSGKSDQKAAFLSIDVVDNLFLYCDMTAYCLSVVLKQKDFWVSLLRESRSGRYS